MRITVFTGNGIRHNYLINQLKKYFKKVYVVKEIPALTKDINNSVLNQYFKNVKKAEENIFFEKEKNEIKDEEIILSYGELKDIKLKKIEKVLNSDIYIVFGSSYIRGELIDFLIDKNCINLHMGISPYYRGSACNFWAQYDNRYSLIGGTIHKISRGLDSGDIIKIVKLSKGKYDRFEIGMIAVKKTIDTLIHLLREKKEILNDNQKQLKEKEIRYSKIKDFTEDHAMIFLKKYKESPIIEIIN